MKKEKGLPLASSMSKWEMNKGGQDYIYIYRERYREREREAYENGVKTRPPAI